MLVIVLGIVLVSFCYDIIVKEIILILSNLEKLFFFMYLFFSYDGFVDLGWVLLGSFVLSCKLVNW